MVLSYSWLKVSDQSLEQLAIALKENKSLSSLNLDL